MKTVPTWGYSKSGPKLFHLLPGTTLPDGWVDSPAKVPGGMELVEMAKVVSPAEQELAETRRLLDEALAENARLKAQVAEMEAALLNGAKPAGEDTSTAIERLRQRAAGLGIKVDLRWGAERLAREIEAAEAAAKAAESPPS